MEPRDDYEVTIEQASDKSLLTAFYARGEP